ncbi:hypothetical protein BH11ACT2_BH11ACT2_00580 [soil metagenome]
MSDLTQQFLVAAFGSFLGAAGAIIAALVLRVRDDRRREASALKALVVDIYFRRALGGAYSHPVSRRGRERAEHSISTLRAQVRRTRDALRPRSRAFDSLSELTRLCNEYLDAVERRPRRYAGELVVLRDRMAPVVAELAERYRFALDDVTPGGGAGT